jgi:selT/selW/selH-like putative selenoprotein
LVDAIRRTYGTGINVEVIQGSGGIFDVVIDGEKVFSKHEEHRFPKNDEILTEIANRNK